jgi:hypothetical protein
MRFDLGTEPLLLDVVSDGPPMRTSGRILMEEDGELTDAIGVSCRLRTASYTSPSNCIDAALVPGDYRIEFSDLPRDAWVVSAAASGADFLTGDVPIEGNVEIEVVLARPGGIVEGVTAGEAGTPLSGAVVALVPDTPLRESGLFYRSAVTDVNGRYRLEGVAPGSYRLYAWTELEGAAYRNAEFMTAYESEGTPVALEGPETITLDITAF